MLMIMEGYTKEYYDHSLILTLMDWRCRVIRMTLYCVFRKQECEKYSGVKARDTRAITLASLN